MRGKEAWGTLQLMSEMRDLRYGEGEEKECGEGEGKRLTRKILNL